MRTLRQAHMSLGDMCEKGEGMPKSQEQAAFHFMFAAERYDAEAQLKVAIMFEEGSVFDKNIDRAVLYFNLSARGGHEIGQWRGASAQNGCRDDRRSC